jgi:hypothetical protein
MNTIKNELKAQYAVQIAATPYILVIAILFVLGVVLF